MAQIKDQSVSPRRLNAALVSSFGMVVVLIAAVGIAGVLAFSVSARTDEIGIRMNLGADRGRVQRALRRLRGVGVEHPRLRMREEWAPILVAEVTTGFWLMLVGVRLGAGAGWWRPLPARLRMMERNAKASPRVKARMAGGSWFIVIAAAASAIAVAVLASGCATARVPDLQPAEESCEFVVDNQTPLALEIRLQVSALATTSLGALNPGELLNHSVPCAQEQVWVAGIEIPWQVGARPRFGVVYGSAELVERDRVRIALHWP